MKKRDMNNTEKAKYWCYALFGMGLVLVSFIANTTVSNIVMSEVANLFVFIVGIMFMRDAIRVRSESSIRAIKEVLIKQTEQLKSFDDDLYDAEEKLKLLESNISALESIVDSKAVVEEKEPVELIVDTPVAAPVVAKRTNKKKAKAK